MDLGELDKEEDAGPYRPSCINGFQYNLNGFQYNLNGFQYNLSIFCLLRTTAASVNKSDLSFCFGGDRLCHLPFSATADTG